MKPFRGKPQQLTLFKAPKPTAEHRWPEGYSPERRNAVAEKVNVIHTYEREDPSNRYGDTTGSGGWTNPEKRSVGSKNVIADIARSSVPTEHLQNPYTGQRLQVQTRNDFTGGLYFGGHGKIAVGVHANPNTLLHEVGHAASDLGYTTHSVRRKDPETQTAHTVLGNMGKEEAFADNYARAHVGAKRGQQPDREERSVYESQSNWERGYTMTPKEAKVAHKSYMNARQFSSTSPARDVPAQMAHGYKPREPGRYWQPEFEQ